MVTKGEESMSFISERILRGEREAGARGSNRFAKSVCEAAFAATCFSSFCWCITNFPDFKLVLTGRKLTQNCVFPICVDLFPMFAPFPPFQPSSWLSVDQSCSTGPNNVATILSPQQRNEPKDFFTEKTKLDLNQIQSIYTNQQTRKSFVSIHVPAGSFEQVLWVQYALEWQQSKGVTDYGKLSCLKSKFIKLHQEYIDSSFHWPRRKNPQVRCSF